LPNDALLSGYEEASSRRGTRALMHDRFVRKWIQLRVNAWLRHRVVDETVTSEFLRTIDVQDCPITGLTLTHGTGQPTDWSVDRLNNEGAYAPGNLVVMSSLANKAKGRKTFAEVWACRSGDASALTPSQWSKMAALMVFPCHIAQTHLPLVPYPLLPPPGVPLAFEQTLQWTLANQCYGGPKAVIGRLKDACATPQRQKLFHQLVQKVRRKSEKLSHFPEVWLNAALWSAFEHFVKSMDDPEFRRMRVLLGTAESNWKCEFVVAWQLDCRGYVPGYSPPDSAALSAGLDRGCDEASYDEVSRVLEAMEPVA
jgi:hypothetical protein